MRSSEITPKSVYLRRREFLELGVGSALALSLPAFARDKVPHGQKLASVSANPKYALAEEKKNSFEDIASYNNFYELGTDKSDPSENAQKLVTRPWTVSVEGEVGKPRKWDIEEILKSFPVEERVYRLRCVEAWSMVVPWDGFPLADFLKKHDPTSRAKYVAFETVVQPQMPGVKGYAGIPFPYLEGLRIDEAMHPLALLGVGLYGEQLPNQDGAPIRLVVPWKYGFKSAKSIVKIRLQETQPQTTWNQYGGGVEYGFYANVNPDVDHPRWSQAKERRIGELLRRKTLMFNGYPEVASLYAGMDLRKFY
ncbi:MAG TPA: protein-methionine-sulfoxide reductase catalytic subunit MsrP [Myxococcales bacterium]|jgi:sulfoxide reductase catalytic subunit YedY|nr:protein-methionine-sulfoxide reductase catalytic subunit MsrP [Myxococcales bacterium]